LGVLAFVHRYYHNHNKESVMKIAVVTAIFGPIDTVKVMPDQTISFDRHIFTQANSPFPFPNLNNRLKAKYFKCQMHKVLPGYDYYIWIDGKIKVTSPLFVESMINLLSKDDIAVRVHATRHCIYQEVDYIESAMAAGDTGLIERYRNQPLRQEVEYYRSKGYPEGNGLYDCSVFIVRSQRWATAVLDEWWSLCLRFSYFDQTALQYVLWKHLADHRPLYLEHLITTEPHIRKKFIGRWTDKLLRRENV
jgi:hypothetical protein